MKLKIIIFLVSILNFQSVFSQEMELEKKFFLLGTLSDYMGRQTCDLESDVVDNYYKFESSLLNYNFDFLKKEYPDLHFDTINNKLKSKKLAKEINENFNYESDDYLLCSDKEDINGNLIDSVFTGKLKAQIFIRKKEKISYIVGAYTRFGRENKTTYWINIANSVSTFPICVELLKQLGCKNVKTEIIENIPWSYNIYFQPTKELEKYLRKYMFLREKLKIDYDIVLKKYLKE